MENIVDNRKIILIPAVISFIVALLLLYKYSYPISWDVYYHIHMAKLYLNNGLIFWDYQTVAPMGRLIMYPPLFHFVLAFFSKFLNMDVFKVAWIFQPLFAFILIFTISFVAYRLSEGNTKVSLFTGLLSLMSFATFNRAVICTPATLAVSSLMLCLLFYYEAFEKHAFKRLILSAVCFALVANLHMASALITGGVLFLYTLYLVFSGKIDWKYLFFYVLMAFVMSCPWWLYIALNYNLVFNSLAGSYLRIDEFLVKYYGIIPSIFAFAGFYTLYKNRSTKSIFLCIWALSIICLSQVPLLGVDTVSIRLFELSAYPLILISGIGAYETFNKINANSLRYIFVGFIVLYSLGASISYVDSYTPDLLDEDDFDSSILAEEFHLFFDPVGSTLKPSIISDRYGSSQLAHNRHDMTNYMMKNNISGLVVSQDAIMDTIILSSTDASVVYGGFTESIPEYVVDPVHIVNSQATLNELDDLGVKYMLIRKDTPIATYAEVEYENDEYKLCKVVLK